MNHWLAQNNIDDFKEKLSRETDLEKRRILTELLEKEEAKLLQFGQ